MWLNWFVCTQCCLLALLLAVTNGGISHTCRLCTMTGTPLPNFSPALLLCILLLNVLPSSGGLDYTQLAITSISSDGSCTDVYPGAYNCTLSTTLTLQVTGIPSSPARDVFHFSFIGARGQVRTYAWTKDERRPAFITVTVDHRDFGAVSLVADELLSVVIVDGGVNRSAPFLGLSFAALPRPVLTTVGGCEGEGAATHNCRPHRDWLVFTGKHLSLFQPRYTSEHQPEYVIHVENHSQEVQERWGFRLHVLSDVEAVLPLHNSAWYVPTTAQFSAEPLAISFTAMWPREQLEVSTNALEVSFASMPAPIIERVEKTEEQWAKGCVLQQASSSLTGCVPQRGYFSLKGHYLSGSNVTLKAAGQKSWPCVDSGSHYTVASCTVPLIPGDNGTRAWDVEVTTAAGSVTVPRLVTFTTSPSLLSFTPCRDVGGLRPYMDDNVFLLDCRPGSILTLHGVRFHRDPNVSVHLSQIEYSSRPDTVNLTCLSATVLDEETVECTVPEAGNWWLQTRFYGTEVEVHVFFPETGERTNAIKANVMAHPESPVIHNVSGCESSLDNMTVTRCRGGDVLTIRGMNLRSERKTHISGFPPPGGYQVCETVPSAAHDPTVLHCQLWGLESHVQEDVVFPMLWDARITLAEHVEISTFGNPFWVSFTREERLLASPQCRALPEK